MKLRYSVHPNGGLFFVEAKEAKRVEQIEKALRVAGTWGDFRELLPPGEYLRIVSSMTRKPADDEAFNANQVPGFSKGQYPPWHQSEMENLLPMSILQTYGQRKFSEDYGSYFHISPSHWHKLVHDLSVLGFKVEDEKGNVWLANTHDLAGLVQGNGTSH